MTQDTDAICHASHYSAFGRRKRGEQRSVSSHRRSQANQSVPLLLYSESNLRFISYSTTNEIDGCSPSRRGIKSRPSLQLEDESNKRWLCSWTRNQLIGDQFTLRRFRDRKLESRRRRISLTSTRRKVSSSLLFVFLIMICVFDNDILVH
ncbi:Uncharacterized protein Rs2_19012 [Raphanus sativus]|nr:Uncharacterized protein Rs2_19012 [Raphanus sativus]